RGARRKPRQAVRAHCAGGIDGRVQRSGSPYRRFLAFLKNQGKTMNELQDTIEQAWERRAELSPGSAPAKIGAAVDEVLAGLDAGKLRVAEKIDGEWRV